MGVAATRRGDKVIARQAEYQYSEHEVAVAKRQIMRENQLLARQVEEQGAELEQLRAQVAELEALRQQQAETTAALVKAEQSRDHFRSLWSELNTIHLERVAKHTKLTEIMMIALTPEQYHQAREIYEHNNPVREE
jgi:dynactin complex subunit